MNEALRQLHRSLAPLVQQHISQQWDRIVSESLTLWRKAVSRINERLALFAAGLSQVSGQVNGWPCGMVRWIQMPSIV